MDIQGTKYKTVPIGRQCWMAENLKVGKYKNGEEIPFVTDNNSWAITNKGSWSYFNNNENNNSITGKLYNWYAISDNRGICPAKWHIPSETEWNILSSFLGGNLSSANKLRGVGDKWNVGSLSANNQSGFNAIPGGFRYFDGSYSDIGNVCFFWSSSDLVKDIAWSRFLTDSSAFNNGLN
jgi:uncharacterized protein (TIGR02145 family)